MRLVLISDTHNRHARVDVPEGDVLIHAGDLTGWGRLKELRRAAEWLAGLPHAHKLVIAGNHDLCLQRTPDEARAVLEGCCTYLEEEGVELAGRRFWGSPWQPAFKNWAFNLPRGEALAARWARIPADTDVLVTHTPPHGTGDRVLLSRRHVGCADLADAVRRVAPRLHVFGHIHEAYGRWQDGPTTYVNATACTFLYRPVNPPVVFELT